MKESEFTILAENTIEKIAIAIEDADTAQRIDVDFLSGVLTLELDNGSEYIINKHEVSKQIWLSSPISGASHFDYKENKWISSYGDDLKEIISHELKESNNIDIDFS